MQRHRPISKERYDVVILGGGNAAMGATVATREAGLSVAMIEMRDLGGTCPNRGCMPKKVLVAAAHALDEIAQAHHHGITVGAPSLDWAALIAREKEMIAGIPDSLAAAMARRGVEIVRGQGKLVGPRSVQVGDRTLEAGHIVIATGSTPRDLPIPGADKMVTSDDVLADPTLPRDVVFIGGGVIALEFSHVYARAGAKVTILEVLPQLLPAIDADAAAQLRGATERLGVMVRTGATVARIDPAGRGYRVVFTEAGAEHSVTTERIVNGAGRVADVDGLGLDAAGVRHEDRQVLVDEFLRSVSNPAVHVCGDALWSSPQLSPIATYEGQIVGHNIVKGPSRKPEYASIPSCIFTVPALATVGLSEAQAREKGLKIRVQTSDMQGWLSAKTNAESAAWAKIVADEASGHILGAQIFGHAAEELIHLFALAIRHGITADQVRATIFAFPTFSADIKYLV
jgi:glutathione reductase (NADPH)